MNKKDSNSFLKSPFKAFLYATQEQRGRLLLMYLMIIIGNAASYSVAYFISQIADSMTESSNFSVFMLPMLCTAGVLVVSELAFRLGHWIEISITLDAYNRITSKVYKTVIEQPAAYFEERFSGEINRRIEQISGGVTSFIEFFPWDLGWMAIGLIMSLILLGTVNMWLLIIFAIWLILFAVPSYFLLRWQSKATEIVSEKSASLSGTIVDVLGNIPLVHAFASHRHEHSYYDRHMNEVIKADKHARYVLLYNKIQQGWSVVILTLSLTIAGIYLFSLGKITIGGFVIIASVIPSVTGIIWSIGETMTRVVRSYSELKNALEALKSDAEYTEDGIEDLTISHPEIRFKDVSFSYTKSTSPVLEGFNLVIKAGERVGLVGESGAGKSTLVKLLLRSYEPVSGSIEFSGQKLSSIKTATLRSNISFVPQDTALFHRSLFDNILYAKPTATKDEVISTSQRAHAHDFIEKYPAAYDTLVGERGIKLSGGQRQRIALARAMLKNSPILILDEATSSLDTESEEIVQNGLQELFKDRTVVAIAHRLSTLRSMDRIIVMKNGQIAEDGAPQDLLSKKSGLFKEMWERQKNGFV